MNGMLVNVCACDPGKHTCDGPSRESLVRINEDLKESLLLVEETARSHARRIEELYRLACAECRKKFDGGDDAKSS